MQSDSVPRQTFESVYVPLPPGAQRLVHLDASAVFPLPGDGRMRSFALKNISFENLSQTDLFARGWHKSGYLFEIHGADTDGWVDKRLDASLPGDGPVQGRRIVQVIRYPSKEDLPLTVTVDGAPPPSVASLGLETTETHPDPAVGDGRHPGRPRGRPGTSPSASPDTRSAVLPRREHRLRVRIPPTLAGRPCC